MKKRTKVVATIGPASESRAMIEKLIKSGMNVARLNFSHGTYKNHSMLIRNVRSSAKKLKTNVAIIQDLQGPRIRIGNIPKAGIEIKKGSKLILVPESVKFKAGDEPQIPVRYSSLYREVKKDHFILIDDASLVLRVLSIRGKNVYCQIMGGGLLKPHKGINFPNSSIRCPATTAKDLKDLEFGIKSGVDYIALSFVRNASDITKLRKKIITHEKKYFKKERFYSKGKNVLAQVHTRIIAKIERREAVDNFDKILKVVDGIMIARGDLGIELPFENLPLIQKEIINKCRKAGKPVIVATQMLDSMIRNPIPTRAEVSDVANAILDGTDAIMLSGETATGKYPVQAVEAMTKIAGKVEKEEIIQQEAREDDFKNQESMTQVMGFLAQDLADDVEAAKLIVCATASGSTARHISSFRPGVPIIAISPSQLSVNQMALSWGVFPHKVMLDVDFDQFLSKVKILLKKEKLVKKDDKFIVVAGHPFNQRIPTNLIKLEEIT